MIEPETGEVLSAPTAPTLRTLPSEHTNPNRGTQVNNTNYNININVPAGVNAQDIADAVRRELDKRERQEKRAIQTRLYD